MDIDMEKDVDQLLNEHFAGRVVRKDLTKLIKEGANVPVYVLEYLLGMYCASDDEVIIQKGLTDVKKILAENYVRPDEAEKVKFYTVLYHVLLGRVLASDVNGAYPKNDGEVGQIELDSKGKPVHNHYNTDAIWGAFWNLTQLWTIAYPEYYSEWIQSQLLVYKDAGWLGDGFACSKYVSGVGTNFTRLAMAEAYTCGIRDFVVELGYEAALIDESECTGRTEGAGKIHVRE